MPALRSRRTYRDTETERPKARGAKDRTLIGHRAPAIAGCLPLRKKGKYGASEKGQARWEGPGSVRDAWEGFARFVRNVAAGNGCCVNICVCMCPRKQFGLRASTTRRLPLTDITLNAMLVRSHTDAGPSSFTPMATTAAAVAVRTNDIPVTAVANVLNVNSTAVWITTGLVGTSSRPSRGR